MRRIEVVYLESPGRPYAYEADEGLELAIGDVVLVPGNWMHPTSQTARVVGLETEYTGPCARVLRVVNRAAKPEEAHTDG